MSKEEATSNIEKELERITVEAESVGVKVKAKITTTKKPGKIKGAMSDLGDKINKIDLASHIKSGFAMIKEKISDIKDKCIKLNDDRKERKKEDKKLITDIGSKIDIILEHIAELEKESKDK